MHERLYKKVQEALAAVGAGEISFVVERPRDMAHGDYSTNAALVAAKGLKKNPQEVAKELVTALGAIEGVGKIEVAGAGFINFTLTHEALVQAVQTAAKETVVPQTYAGKKILVEYTSPNLFKPLHIGNLIGNILGESVARILERSGAAVKRINYPSDIGLTVAKAVWGLQKLGLDPKDITQLGRAYVAGTEAYEGAAKKEIEAVNKALYENTDPALSALRATGVETSRRHLDELCARLGTKFDTEFFESETGPIGRELVHAHKGEVFEESEGAMIYRGEQDGLHTRVFLNSQGLPTYEAKDLGLLTLKLKTYPDFNITITDTGPEQTEYFKVLYAAARKVFPELKDRTLLHIAHGYLKLTTGKMASRVGNVITGESLLAELQEEAKEKMKGRELADPTVAEQVAVGALKYAVLKQGSGKDIIFDPEKSLSLEGDSGPYLQYARVRALSLLRTAKEAGIEEGTEDAPERAGVLERMLVHYAGAVERAAVELEPHYVTTYLTELAGAFNSWYASTRVVGGTSPRFGVLLTAAFEKTMTHGLQVLGIPAPKEM